MYKKNTAVTGLFLGTFQQLSGGLPQTAGTVAGTRLLDGVGGAIGNAAVYDATAKGWKVNLSAGDMNADEVGLHFELTGCANIDFSIRTDKPVSDLNDLAAASVASPAQIVNLSGSIGGKISTMSAAIGLGGTGVKVGTGGIQSSSLAAPAITQIQLGVARQANVEAIDARVGAYDTTVLSAADARNIRVTSFPVGSDFTKHMVRIRNNATGKSDTRRIYSMNAATGDMVVEPDMNFVASPLDKVFIYDPMLLKTDFLMDGNAVHSSAGGAIYALDEAGAVLANPGDKMDLVDAPSATAIAAIKAGLTLPTGIPKGVALSNFTFPMWDLSNPEKVKTGLTVAGQIRKDGGSFAALTNAISEVGTTGMYKVNITNAEMNADLIELLFTATGAADQPVLIKTNV